MKLFNIIISIALVATFGNCSANTSVVPFSVLTDKHTAQLECVVNKYLVSAHPVDELIKMDITSEDAIKKLFSRDSSALDLYKAFVMDYYYQNAKAEEYYKNSAESSKKSFVYYINFLARTHSYKDAVKKLKSFSLFKDVNKLNKLSAMIYIAHEKKIESSLNSKLRRAGIAKNEIEKEFYGCK